MNTDTPRTDAKELVMEQGIQNGNRWANGKYVYSDDARQLERELTEALQQRNLTISELASFQAELTAQQEKVKRLREALVLIGAKGKYDEPTMNAGRMQYLAQKALEETK